MKYPWVAIAVATVWFGSTYLVLKSDQIDVTFVLSIAILGTAVMSFLGFRVPKIKG